MGSRCIVLNIRTRVLCRKPCVTCAISCVWIVVRIRLARYSTIMTRIVLRIFPETASQPLRSPSSMQRVTVSM